MNESQVSQELEKNFCCVRCGRPLDGLGDTFEDFHPDKGYEYCHSFCCLTCCPDTNKEFCQKEILEGAHIQSTITWAKRKEYV
ncbi:MAG: hypothetical protein ACFE9L_09215 [Candidatus Hodarchaeota archaeon]